MLSSLENFPLDIPESTICCWSHVYLCFAYFKENAALQVDGTLGPKIHGLFISLNSRPRQNGLWPKLAQNVFSEASATAGLKKNCSY